VPRQHDYAGTVEGNWHWRGKVYATSLDAYVSTEAIPSNPVRSVLRSAQEEWPMLEPTSFLVVAPPPCFCRTAAQTTSLRAPIFPNHSQAAAPRGNSNPSRKARILNRNTASILPPICLILKDGKLPNPGKNTFHRFPERYFPGDTRSKANPSTNRFAQAPILNRNTASIPSPMCLILNDGKLPKPGKIAFYILAQPSSKAAQPARGIWPPPACLTSRRVLCFLYLRHLNTTLPEVS
jgi:hypothetical protein